MGDCAGPFSLSAPGLWLMKALELVHRLVLRSAYLLPDAQVAKTPEFTIIIMDLNWVLFAYS